MGWEQIGEEGKSIKKMLEAIVKPRRAIAKRAMALIKTEDAYTTILRGHSMIQASIYDAVMVKSTNRPAFMKVRLSFISTVHLAIAFEVISDEWEAFLKSLDSLRGELAHSFEAEIDDEKIDMLTGKAPKRLTESYEGVGLTRLPLLQSLLLLAVLQAQTHEREHELQRMIGYMRENPDRYGNMDDDEHG